MPFILYFLRTNHDYNASYYKEGKSMPEMEYNDLRDFLELCQKHGEVEVIKDADWNLEIGALTEAAAELLTDPPLLLFDSIKGYAAGYLVLCLVIASYKRAV